MSVNFLQAENISERSDLPWFFLISAEHSITIITTYSGWKLWNSILWGNTVFLLIVWEQRPVLVSNLTDSVINTFYESMNGTFDSLQLYKADVSLWHVINLFHSLRADWSPQTARKLQFCMAHTNNARGRTPLNARSWGQASFLVYHVPKYGESKACPSA